jgi:hypothetical protein
MQYVRLVFALVAVVPAAGCLTDLGECDPSKAREVVFLDTRANIDTANGQPMYAGQALMFQSCGNGQHCHSENVSGAARYGVPHGLDYDFELICTDGACQPFSSDLDPIRHGQQNVIDHARLIMSTVRHGNMPPGAIGSDIASKAPDFRHVSLVPGAVFTLRDQTFACDDLPEGTCAPGQTEVTLANPFLDRVGTSVGNETLRNWLACGSPVVESTDEPGSVATGGDCSLPGEVGHAGDCVVRIPAEIDPPAQNWASIYNDVLKIRCGETCHTPSDSVPYHASGLDLSTREVAYTSLFGSAASGTQCGGNRTLITPGDPDNSLLIQKLERTQDCGDPMPTGSSVIAPAVVEVIRAWIEAGAPND